MKLLHRFSSTWSLVKGPTLLFFPLWYWKGVPVKNLHNTIPLPYSVAKHYPSLPLFVTKYHPSFSLSVAEHHPSLPLFVAEHYPFLCSWSWHSKLWPAQVPEHNKTWHDYAKFLATAPQVALSSCELCNTYNYHVNYIITHCTCIPLHYMNMTLYCILW